MCCVHVHILKGISLLLSCETSPVPAQHIMHPASHGFMAVTSYLAALFFILQSNKKRKSHVNLCSSPRSASLSPIHSKDAPFSFHLRHQPLPTKTKRFQFANYSRKGREINFSTISITDYQAKFTYTTNTSEERKAGKETNISRASAPLQAFYKSYLIKPMRRQAPIFPFYQCVSGGSAQRG